MEITPNHLFAEIYHVLRPPAGHETRVGFLFVVPIALGNTVAFNPNLADLAGQLWLARPGINDQDLLIWQDATGCDELPRMSAHS